MMLSEKMFQFQCIMRLQRKHIDRVFARIQEIQMPSFRANVQTSSCDLKIVPKNLKGKSKSSQEWLTRQLNDPYVKKAHDMNYRARSAFKLIEIDDKAKILKPGQVVVECGASPGAWTQVIVERTNSNGKVPTRRAGTVIGIDLLPIAPMDGAVFLDGYDFTSTETLEKIKKILEEKVHGKTDANVCLASSDTEPEKRRPNIQQENYMSVDVILSDMAPNATGQRDTDHPRIVKLVEAALVFAIKNGKQKGHFLAKVWDGSDVQKLEKIISQHYTTVTRHKPQSSRRDSSELFILGKFKK